MAAREEYHALPKLAGEDGGGSNSSEDHVSSEESMDEDPSHQTFPSESEIS